MHTFTISIYHFYIISTVRK